MYLCQCLLKLVAHDFVNALQVEYDPRVITFRQLLDVFWDSHDSRQVFGQGPDVGNQYR